MKEPPGIETNSARTVTVLSVSPSKADHAVLCSILQDSNPEIDTDCRWMIYPATSAASAEEVLSGQEIPVVISEDNLFPDTWRAILQHISLLPDPPFLIVASRLADERLWAEALNLGAWDVLAKPFDAQEVIRVVASAWRHWQDRREPGTRQKAAATVT